MPSKMAESSPTDKASILEKAKSTNKINGYVFEMELPKEYEAREKRILDFNNAVCRRKIGLLLADDTSKLLELPLYEVTLEMVKLRGLSFDIFECVGNKSQLDAEQSKGDNSEPSNL